MSNGVFYELREQLKQISALERRENVNEPERIPSSLFKHIFVNIES